MKPLVFDLYCGLFGWGEAFAKAGYRVIGFDVENQFANFGKQMPANCELVLRDARSLTGTALVQEYGVPACIVASPPCQEFSYMAMPWSKAKEKRRKILADPAERKRLTDLFNQCFRIQREVSAAAGHYVPIIIENVRGAQEWVGKSRWNFGSYYLWGDVPALMPIPGKLRKTPDGSWDQNRANYNPDHGWKGEGVKAGDRNVGKNGEHKWNHSFSDALRGEGNKTAGMNWSDQTKRGQDFTRVAGQQSADSFGWSKDTPLRDNNSKSLKRKEASAVIARIPPALAEWIARCFYPANGIKPGDGASHNCVASH